MLLWKAFFDTFQENAPHLLHLLQFLVFTGCLPRYEVINAEGCLGCCIFWFYGYKQLPIIGVNHNLWLKAYFF